MAIRNDLSSGTKSELIAYNAALDTQVFLVAGDSTIGDSGMRFYYYSASSIATVDGENVLDATGMGVGRYLKSFPFGAAAVPFGSLKTRALNSAFTPSTTRPTLGIYSVTCSVTNPLLAGTSTANVYLEYSTDGGTTWQTAANTSNSSGVTLTVTVQLTDGQTGVIAGLVPANALSRIRTSTSGTATIAYVSGQEITF